MSIFQCSQRFLFHTSVKLPGNGKIVHAAGPKYGVIVSKTGVGGKITDVRRIVR